MSLHGVDPFPNIAPALLHSGALLQYANYIPPNGRPLFSGFNPKNLKSASYEIPFEGTAFWWDDSSNDVKSLELDGMAVLEIPQNGIVFVRPKVYFSVPDYLALRFNLTIKLVHRGLLLGTGPLVDPGFEGRLLIPVHNLTNEPLRVSANFGFIWIEVTKVSPLDPNDPTYVRFPQDKKDLQPEHYFLKANMQRPIRSSIPEATREVQNLKKLLYKLSLGGFVAIAVAIVWPLYQFIESTKSLVVSAQQSSDSANEKMTQDYRSLSEKLRELQTRLDDFEKAAPKGARVGNAVGKK